MWYKYNNTCSASICALLDVCMYMYLRIGTTSPPTGPTGPLPTQGGTELGGMLV